MTYKTNNIQIGFTTEQSNIVFFCTLQHSSDTHISHHERLKGHCSHWNNRSHMVKIIKENINNQLRSDITQQCPISRFSYRVAFGRRLSHVHAKQKNNLLGKESNVF